MGAIEDLKNVIDQMCDASKSIADKAGLTEIDVDQAARVELACYMMYLSASDHTISTEESVVISKLCGLDLTPAQINQFILQKNIYSTEFEEKVPISMKIAVAGDKMLEAAGEETAGSVSDALIKVYELAGQVLTQSDGDVSSEEKVDYKIYTDMLKAYRSQNVSDAKSDEINKDNNGPVAAPSKNSGSVKAPRKG